jgi:phi13 family phage major tail protein
MQIGIQNLHIAWVDKDGGARIYGTPVPAARSIKIDLSTEFAGGELWARDELIYSEKDFLRGKVILNTADFSPEIIKELLGLEEDAQGVLYAGKETDEDPPTFAIGFQSQKAGGKVRYIWLLEVTFSTPNESYETMKDGINLITPTIEGQFVQRPDGLWKADYVGFPSDDAASDWFEEVHTFVSSRTQKGIQLDDLTGLIVTGVWESAGGGKLSC